MMVAERFHTIETGIPALDRLRAYLSEWQVWEKRYVIDNGYPSSAPWARFMKTSAAWDAEATGVATINVPAMQIIDSGMESLHKTEPVLSIAIRWRYLNVSVQAHVFRHKRLAGLSMEQLDELADGGERALLPIVVRLGMLL